MMNYWKAFGNIRGGKKKAREKRGDERGLPNLGPCPNPFGQGNKLVSPMTMSKSKLVWGGGRIIGSPCFILQKSISKFNYLIQT
jgi:hypothetical protein